MNTHELATYQLLQQIRMATPKGRNRRRPWWRRRRRKAIAIGFLTLANVTAAILWHKLG